MYSNIAAILFDPSVSSRNEEDIGERHRVVTELLEQGKFSLKSGVAGPYTLHIGVRDSRVAFEVKDHSGNLLDTLIFSISPLRRLIKDYDILCESYAHALKDAPPDKVEAMDMGRRSMHNEAAEIMSALLVKQVDMDFQTARRFFTLVYILSRRG